MSGASHTAVVRVIYGDTDMMGMAYYANYLRWFEVGRNELIRARGMTYRQFEERGLILPVIEANVRYKKSAVYDDELEIATEVAAAGRVKLEFRYQVWRREGASGPRELLAEGSTVHACLAREGGKPTRLPEDVLAALGQLVT